MANALKVSRVQKRGQVTIPIEIRRRLGLDEGDLVAFVETSQGVLLSPQEVVLAHAINQVESALRAKGVGLSDLFTFADGLANGAEDEQRSAATARKGQSIAKQTAGIFARPDRGPIDFQASRQEFMEESVRRAQTVTSSEHE